MAERTGSLDAPQRPARGLARTPLRLALATLLLLGVYTVGTWFFPALEYRAAYRILVVTTVVVALLFIHRQQYMATGPKGKRSDEDEGDLGRRRVEMRISMLLLSMLAFFVLLTFPFPGILSMVSVRTLSFTVVVISLMVMLAVGHTLGAHARALREAHTGIAAGGLSRRFFISLGIFIVLPIYFVAAYFFPGIERTLEVRVLILGIIGVSLAGFWTVSRDIFELRRILRLAQEMARHPGTCMLETHRDGEIGELAEAFNVIFSELNEKMDALERARQRVEAMMVGIGNAVSSAGDLSKLRRLALDTAADVLNARLGFLYITKCEAHSESWETVERGGEVEGAEIEACRTKVRRVAATLHPRQDKRFIALPLVRDQRGLGVMALIRDRHQEPFGEHERELADGIAERTAQAIKVSRTREDEEQVYFETISALALAVEARDPYMRGHSARVSRYATAIAREMGLSVDDVETIRMIGLVHDIGKVGVPDSVITKRGPVTSSDYDVARQHAVIGEQILKPLHSLERLLPGIRSHHEWINGRGYPDGLAGDKIDPKARILAVADAFDAMLSDRPYRSAFSLEEATEQIRTGIGSQFDRGAALALLALIKQGRLQADGGRAEPAASATTPVAAGSFTE